MPRRSVAVMALVLVAAPAAAQSSRQGPQVGAAQPWRCGTKTYCTQMTSCAEAMFHFQRCGLARLDGDRDGVPCETMCGPGPRRGSTRRR